MSASPYFRMVGGRNRLDKPPDSAKYVFVGEGIVSHNGAAGGR